MPKRKRRWFRFSLKAFLVVLTVFCVWLGLLVYRVNKQKEVVRWVKEQGGKVDYEIRWDQDNRFIDHAKPPGPEWLRELIGVYYFADVVNVDFTAVLELEHIEPLVKMKGVLIVLDKKQQVTVRKELKDRVLRSN